MRYSSQCQLKRQYSGIYGTENTKMACDVGNYDERNHIRFLFKKTISSYAQRD